MILSIKKKINFESDALGVLLPLVMASAYVTNNTSIGYSNLATIAVGIFIPVYFLGKHSIFTIGEIRNENINI
ncbi:MAG: hypothetical protein LKH59_07865 [Lactobacillus crispatus]|jgi:hypothetical protein|uniref:hypothetical protein n=1 Tax=Lactobacillus crispatus TaxID=47770 RepID=UPI001E3FF257|nr:hypothetical protein [Lactobacillus crispatus]MCH4005491.1 hypothetical protein [Lactobacillus crispatus]MCI1336604.1 hypothetical protein [Lactobacillus crispatus]MCI1366162.1 hypothetical protein [Lactobacillus crispatus]MCI1494482.1 hypothetical protein [Lactobacillus crispatus]MCI1538779.1 hypothetical protein [Lactobacillus crispatus]